MIVNGQVPFLAIILAIAAQTFSLIAVLDLEVVFDWKKVRFGSKIASRPCGSEFSGGSVD